MRNVSDIIEQYLKNILLKSQDGSIEIQRNDLADQFQCVPSQINYVISTRFTLEKGFIVESKRGGGGYIRIQKVQLPTHHEIQGHIFQAIGKNIDQQTAEGLIYQLKESKYLNQREAAMLTSAVSRDVLQISLPQRDQIRAAIMKAMLIALLNNGR
jgi:transcriptional regulator of stress and heat shock response